MPSDFIKVIEQIIREARPDIDIRSFKAVHSLLIKPHALLLEPLANDVEVVKTIQSIVSSDTLTTEEMDSLIANYFISRLGGDFSTGLIRVYFEAPTPVTFGTELIFTADNGSSFSVEEDKSFSSSMMRLNREGSLYYVDVPVKATLAGASSRIEPHTLTSIEGASFTFVKVDNPYRFTGGVDIETNAELKARAADAITKRDLVSGRGCRTILRENFSFIERIFIAGFLDPEQQRDVFEGIHIGNKADVYIKASTLQTEQVLLTTPDDDGNFVLSDGAGAPGDEKRPVVFIDSVKLLSGGIPVGDPLNRSETELVVPNALASSGEFHSPDIEYNSSLNRLNFVAVEHVGESQERVVFAQLSIQGAFQIAITPISDVVLKVSSPHIRTNPGNNRAYVVWGEGERVQCKVLDVSGATLSVVKEAFTITEDNGELRGRIDSQIADDGHFHFVFTLRTYVGEDFQDAPWYARLDTDGEIPGLVDPRQLVVGASGNNRDPSVTVHGNGAALVVTVVYASHREDYANLYALQLDDDGQFIGGSTPESLTIGFFLNDFPTIRKGPSDSIHLLWRFREKGLSYMNLASNGLVILQPETVVLTRAEVVDQLRMETNIYGQLYAAWAELTGDFTNILTSKISPEGEQVGPVHNVTDTEYFSSAPSLVMDATGAIHLVWLDGSKGRDKPFYTKRSPQEWHLIVDDANFRYSGEEALKIVTEIPAAGGVGLDIQWGDLLGQVQEFVDNDEERTVVADYLIRHYIPATVDCDIRFGPVGGSLTEAAAQDLVESFFDAFDGTTLEVSSITDLLFENGATSVTPFEVTVNVDQIEGVIREYKGDDSIVLPRGIFLSPGTVTVRFKE